MDKQARRDCSGCVYSCYYMVQRSFRPRNWADVALLWWQANTEPGSPQRRIGDRFGWVAGLCSFLMPRLAARVAVPYLSSLILMLALAGGLRAAVPEMGLSPAAVIDRMEESGRRQRETLGNWTGVRTYTASNSRLRISAKVKVRFDFATPGRKTWRILERSGSALIADRVIQPILEAECESAGTRRHADIDRRNYRFEFVKFDPDERVYVFEAMPLVPGKYLFQGRIWVDSATFGVRRVAGAPARAPSYWVKSTSFLHE
jgi:hypothetical protein